jgi:hypothetical protein
MLAGDRTMTHACARPRWTSQVGRSHGLGFEGPLRASKRAHCVWRLLVAFFVFFLVRCQLRSLSVEYTLSSYGYWPHAAHSRAQILRYFHDERPGPLFQPSHALSRLSGACG